MRKKGANNNNIDSSSSSSINSRVKSVVELQLGDLVLAKVKGFPAWPAKVSRPEDWERTPDPNRYFVQFFGTQEIAFVAPGDIQAFTGESKSKLLARCKGKTVKYFAQAVKEICEAFEELEKHGNIRGVLKHDISEVNDGKVNGSHVKSTKILKPGELCQSNYVLDRAALICDSTMGDNQTAAVNDSIAHRHDKIKTRKAESFSQGHVQALFSGTSLFNPGKERTFLDENKTGSAFHECIEFSKATSSSPYYDGSDVERDSSRHGAGTKDTSMSLGASGHLKIFTGEDKMSAIIDKSKGMKVGIKRKVDGVIGHADDGKSGGYFGDGALKKVSAGGDAKRLASDLDKESNTQGNASKNLFRSPKLSHVSKTSPKNLVTNAEEHVDGGYPRQKNGHSGSEQSLSVKKSNPLDRKHDAAKGSVLKNGKSNLEAEMLDKEAVPPVPKRHHHALDAVSHDGKRSLGIAYLKNDVKKKRRAVRLCDDDEPKTPVHGGSIKYAVKVGSSALISDSVKKTHENNVSYIRAGQNSKGVNRDEGGFLKDYHPSAKPAGESSLGATLSLKAGSFAKVSVSHTSGLEALDKRVVKESKTDLISPIKFPQVVAGVKKSADQQKPNKPFDKVTGSVSQIKAQCVSGKDPIGMPCGSRFSQSQVSAQKTRQPISEQRAKIPPKIGVELTEQAAFIDNHKDNDSEVDGRLEDTRGKSGSLVDSNLKNLIAAAQAKMRLAHMHNVPHGGGDSLTAPSANLLGRSPTPSSTHQAFLSCGGNVTQLDAQGVKPLGSFASPSDRTLWLGSQESEEKELILGHQSAGRALSGGTEAAVARDAFEGMIETLSRTKESIGRATRLAIDCAKYGIANEILDLLIHKLENESSLPRKVDLFFLADSITQCSHSQKGIAGASYLPAVQASLPRLLGGAAPPGPNARENRRQCLKVLRLWVERKILPESVVRRFMDDIEGSNDDTSTGVSYKRPSRADRSVDDPIREMEGMFVDEYGSNATFNLPGFLTAHGFADDEEDGDDIPSTLHNQSEASPLQPCTKAFIGPETGIDTPNDRCHHILEDVDGELEMEDVSGHPKRGALSPYGFSKIDEQELQLDTEVDPSTYNIVEPLSLHDSPPLPLESPPPLPPLPSSPHPPPPPPLSPSPPPPPPPPSTLLSQPSLPSFLSSGPSQAGNLQQLVPLQSSVTPQAVLHPPVAIPSVQVRHAVQMAGNTSQQMPHFMPPGPSISRPLEYGQTDMYPGPQAGPSNQQFQPSQATFVQRAFPQVSLPQPRLGPFVYNQPLIQRHLPHPRSHLPAFPPPPSHPYSASNSEGLRRFSDEQWRSAPAEYKADNHYNAWVNGGRPQSCPTTTFIGEAYFQPPEGGLTDHLRHNSSVPNSAMGGPSLSGHVINQMLPSRPDMSSLSCWRPV